MANIEITGVTYTGKNPISFQQPFQFRIKFEVFRPVIGEVEWKFIYLADGTNEKFDQVLDTVVMDNLTATGTKMFDVSVNFLFLFLIVLKFKAPNPQKIPQSQILGVSALIIAGLYDGKEFTRIGYYVNNGVYNNEGVLISEEQLKQMNVQIGFDKIQRNILLDPRITKFVISWNSKQQESKLKQQMQLGQQNQQLPQSFLGDVNYKQTIDQRFNNLFGQQPQQQQFPQQPQQSTFGQALSQNQNMTNQQMPQQQGFTGMQQQQMTKDNNQMGQKYQNSLFNY